MKSSTTDILPNTESDNTDVDKPNTDDNNIVVDSRIEYVQSIRSLARTLSPNFLVGGIQRLCLNMRLWIYCCSVSRPKLTAFLTKFLLFFLFSQFVTVLQWMGFLFMPHIPFLQVLKGVEWFLPSGSSGKGWLLYTVNGKPYYWSILGYAVVYDAYGNALVGGGLGYFIAVQTTTFLAQIVNFPLQRNLAFKSSGNPWYQALWYLIGWVVCSLLVNAINNLWLPIAQDNLSPTMYTLIYTIGMSGIFSVVFFFIFSYIFPNNDTMRKRHAITINKMTSKGMDKSDKVLSKQAQFDALMCKVDAKQAQRAKTMAGVYAHMLCAMSEKITRLEASKNNNTKLTTKYNNLLISFDKLRQNITI